MANLHKIQITSHGFGDCIDLTRKINNIIRGDYIINVFAPPACSVVALPRGAEIVQDLKEIIEQIVPIDKHYKFDLKHTNAYAHLRAALLGRNITVTKSCDEQIILIDFNNVAQTRTIFFQVIG